MRGREHSPVQGPVGGVGGGRRKKEDASVMVVLSRGVKWVSLSLLESEIRGGGHIVVGPLFEWAGRH